MQPSRLRKIVLARQTKSRPERLSRSRERGHFASHRCPPRARHSASPKPLWLDEESLGREPERLRLDQEPRVLRRAGRGKRQLRLFQARTTRCLSGATHRQRRAVRRLRRVMHGVRGTRRCLREAMRRHPRATLRQRTMTLCERGTRISNEQRHLSNDKRVGTGNQRYVPNDETRFASKQR